MGEASRAEGSDVCADMWQVFYFQSNYCTTALLFSLGRAVAAERALREALVKNQLNAPE